MALIGGARWTRYFFLVICCKKVISTHWPAGTEIFSPWSYQNHKHQLVGNSQLCLNVSLIKRKKKKSVWDLTWFPVYCTWAGSGRDSWVTKSARQNVTCDLAWEQLVGNTLHIQEATSSAGVLVHGTTKSHQEGLRGDKPLPQRCGLHNACGGTSGLSDQGLRERDPWEGRQDRNVPPPLQFYLNHWQDHHEDPGDLKGQQTLSGASLLSRLKKSFHTASESSKSPKVTAIRIDVGNFTHKLNLLVPSMEAQWLCLAASEGIWGLEIWHVKDKKHLII